MTETQVAATKTIQQMLVEYNGLVPKALALGCVYRERKVFKDRSDAIKSLEQIESSLRAARGASPGLQRLRDSVQGETIRQQVLADQAKASAEAQPQKVVEIMSQVEHVAEEKTTKRRGREPAFAGDMVITVKAEKNPKREGSRGHACFSVYKDGMTVEKYIAKVGDRAEAFANLRYDAGKGYISVA